MATSLSAQIEEWRKQLLDISKRNRLVSLNLGRAGAVKLVHPGADSLWTSLVSEGKTMLFPLKRTLLDERLESQEIEPTGLYPSLFDPETESKLPVEAADLRIWLASPHLCEDHILTDLTDKLLKSRLGRIAQRKDLDD